MRLTFGNSSLEGASRGGDRTWFRVHPPGLAFDVGRGAVGLSGARDLFITHGHLDHCLGLPFVLSYRARHGGGATRVGCPAAIAPLLEDWLRKTAELEAAEYEFELLALEPGDRVGVGDALTVEAFATTHVVPSLGYRLLRGRRRLAERYRGLAGAELAAARARGEELEERWEEDWLAYTGDTSAEVLDREPSLYRSATLVLECTFLDPQHRDRAARYGHVHFEDLVERRDRFDNEHLVLCHLSRRHSEAELEAAVRGRLGALADRVRWIVA